MSSWLAIRCAGPAQISPPLMFRHPTSEFVAPECLAPPKCLAAPDMLRPFHNFSQFLTSSHPQRAFVAVFLTSSHYFSLFLTASRPRCRMTHYHFVRTGKVSRHHLGRERAGSRAQSISGYSSKSLPEVLSVRAVVQ